MQLAVLLATSMSLSQLLEHTATEEPNSVTEERYRVLIEIHDNAKKLLSHVEPEKRKNTDTATGYTCSLIEQSIAELKTYMDAVSFELSLKNIPDMNATKAAPTTAQEASTTEANSQPADSWMNSRAEITKRYEAMAQLHLQLENAVINIDLRQPKDVELRQRTRAEQEHCTYIMQLCIALLKGL